MSNEADLDWLARNVQVWPCGMREVLACYPRNVNALIWSCVSSNAGWITKEQWITRRAELQNKPSWDLSGSWAEYLAQDMDGEWKWLGENPSLGDEYWTADELRSQCKGVVIGDWYDTLEKRPEQFKPFTSIEDNQDQKMKRDDGWFERGDLPPVGIAVQLWHGGTYAYDCELISKRGNDFVLWNLTWDRPDSADCMMCVFKPTPTERDVLIKMLADFDGSPASAGAVADAILAAGFSRRDK